LATLILVSSDDLVFLDLLTGGRIVRPERDPRNGAHWFRAILDLI
jgi:hypothetical protein